jgi:hypothetical protein
MSTVDAKDLEAKVKEMYREVPQRDRSGRTLCHEGRGERRVPVHLRSRSRRHEEVRGEERLHSRCEALGILLKPKSDTMRAT